MVRQDVPYVVTGATRGIGQAVALGLASAGARVIGLSRDATRGRALLGQLSSAGGDGHEVVACDLSRLDSVRDAAGDITKRHAELAGVINCAAVFARTRRTSVEGLELMFVTNHLGPFLLTNRLLPALRKGAPSRVLTIAAPATTKLDLDDLQSARRFSAIQAFGASKVANLLFTFELARRLQGTGVTADAIHPGIVKTDLLREQPFPFRLITRLLGKRPEAAAVDVIRARDAPGVDGEGRLLKAGNPIAPPAASMDRQTQERLWEVSEKLTYP